MYNPKIRRLVVNVVETGGKSNGEVRVLRIDFVCRLKFERLTQRNVSNGFVFVWKFGEESYGRWKNDKRGGDRLARVVTTDAI